MLHPDVQAETILSFQAEKRQRYLHELAVRNSTGRPSGWRLAALAVAGGALIEAGRALQRLGGAALADFDTTLSEAAR